MLLGGGAMVKSWRLHLHELKRPEWWLGPPQQGDGEEQAAGDKPKLTSHGAVIVPKLPAACFQTRVWPFY